MFQHTAARRRLGPQWADLLIQGLFQHTAARRRLQQIQPLQGLRRCFNTQPPEGGCMADLALILSWMVSTHSRPKAAVDKKAFGVYKSAVSTHSRPKAAEKAYLL